MRMMGAVTMFWVAGCGVAEQDFPRALAESTCDHLVGCFPAAYASFDSCVSEQLLAPGAGCVYQESAARDCLRALDDLDCPLDGAAPAWPESCSAAWTECAP